MVLDNDLLREILLYIEENGNGKKPIQGLNIDTYTENEIFYHYKRLLEDELIDGDLAGLQAIPRFKGLTMKRKF